MCQRGLSAVGASPRRLGAIVGGVAGAGVRLATLTGFGTAGAATRAAVSSTQGPTVHEQAAYNQNVAVATNNVHTIVSSSPVLAEGAYHLMLCATVYSGPAGPVAYSWSMNETPFGKAVVSSLT